MGLWKSTNLVGWYVQIAPSLKFITFHMAVKGQEELRCILLKSR